jgi:hypothetical protein
MFGVLFVLSACGKTKPRTTLGACDEGDFVGPLTALGFYTPEVTTLGSEADATWNLIAGATSTATTEKAYEVDGHLAIFGGATGGGKWFKATVASGKVEAAGCTAEPGSSNDPTVKAFFALAKAFKAGSVTTITNGQFKGAEDAEWAYQTSTALYVSDGTTVYKKTGSGPSPSVGAAPADDIFAIAPKFVADGTEYTGISGWTGTSNVLSVVKGDDLLIGAVDTTNNILVTGSDVVIVADVLKDAAYNVLLLKEEDKVTSVQKLKISTAAADAAAELVAINVAGTGVVGTLDPATGKVTIVEASSTQQKTALEIAKDGVPLVAGTYRTNWGFFENDAKFLVNLAGTQYLGTVDDDGVIIGLSNSPPTPLTPVDEFAWGFAELNGAAPWLDYREALSQPGKKVNGGYWIVGTEALVQIGTKFYIVPTTGTPKKFDLTNAPTVAAVDAALALLQYQVLGGTLPVAAAAACKGRLAGNFKLGDYKVAQAEGATGANDPWFLTLQWEHAGAVRKLVWQVDTNEAATGLLASGLTEETAGDPEYCGLPPPLDDATITLVESAAETPTETVAKPDDDDNKFPVGGIVGIVIGVVVVLGVAGFLVYWFVLKKGPVGGGDGAPAGEGAADAPATAD